MMSRNTITITGLLDTDCQIKVLARHNETHWDGAGGAIWPSEWPLCLKRVPGAQLSHNRDIIPFLTPPPSKLAWLPLSTDSNLGLFHLIIGRDITKLHNAHDRINKWWIPQIINTVCSPKTKPQSHLFLSLLIQLRFKLSVCKTKNMPQKSQWTAVF